MTIIFEFFVRKFVPKNEIYTAYKKYHKSALSVATSQRFKINVDVA